MSPGSVTNWVDQLKEGDSLAAEKLWQRYFNRLVELARARLGSWKAGLADEEDVAQSAFISLCRGAEQGRFPNLHDRDELWRLLVVITRGKAADLFEREGRQKRGGGMARVSLEHFQQITSQAPTPQDLGQLQENVERLLERLQDPALRQIALWKLEGHTNAEIAQKLNCVERTIERRLRLIRSLWCQEN